jgi:hypothetical protein
MNEDMPRERESGSEPPSGNSLEDAAEEASRELERRKDGTGHAGSGDIG